MSEGELKKRAMKKCSKLADRASEHGTEPCDVWDTQEALFKIVEDAKKDFLGIRCIGIAAESTHTGKRGRPKKYIGVQVSGFSDEQKIEMLQVENKKFWEIFDRWFGK